MEEKHRTTKTHKQDAVVVVGYGPGGGGMGTQAISTQHRYDTQGSRTNQHTQRVYISTTATHRHHPVGEGSDFSKTTTTYGRESAPFQEREREREDSNLTADAKKRKRIMQFWWWEVGELLIPNTFRLFPRVGSIQRWFFQSELRL